MVSLKRVHESADYFFIVMELAYGGSLRSFIKEKQVTDEECSIIIKQVLKGLQNIHKHHIVHRDINLNNILLRSDKHLEDSVLIIDFGLGAEVTSYNNECLNKRCGTILYMAPEQISGNMYSTVCFYIE